MLDACSWILDLTTESSLFIKHPETSIQYLSLMQNNLQQGKYPQIFPFFL
jgi:hypothetical protein